MKQSCSKLYSQPLSERRPSHKPPHRSAALYPAKKGNNAASRDSYLLPLQNHIPTNQSNAVLEGRNKLALATKWLQTTPPLPLKIKAKLKTLVTGQQLHRHPNTHLNSILHMGVAEKYCAPDTTVTLSRSLHANRVSGFEMKWHR